MSISTSARTRVDDASAVSPAGWLSVSMCPAWCSDSHNGMDYPEDREHGCRYLETDLQTMPYDNYGTDGNPRYRPCQAMANLVQHYREGEPRVCFADSSDKATYYMTLDEAQEIAFHLLTLVAAGRNRAEIGEIPQSVSVAEGCQPWCNRHRPGDCCASGNVDGAWLTYDDEQDGALIWFHTSGDGGLPVSEAERLALAISRAAVLARRSRLVESTSGH
ncbi:hypothetical protein [Nonomuraea rubra]|uniref:Uncharacterized protein n=1 Tax=Nonomuraea rubra TaxID=46180 RepID=A0A7X0NNW5_9ACTN|nr:hypothetical protein [Nonomuraea rubra]MBB6546866.1 hypothetical protein [Nonomuraea rubra]